MNDKRYNSGTCLNPTGKERLIESLERELSADFSDALFVRLKELTCDNLRELTTHLKALKETFE